MPFFYEMTYILQFRANVKKKENSEHFMIHNSTQIWFIFAGIFSYNKTKGKGSKGWLFSWQGPYLHGYVLAQQKTAASLRGRRSLSRGVWRRRPPLELYQFSRYASVPPPPVASLPPPHSSSKLQKPAKIKFI